VVSTIRKIAGDAYFTGDCLLFPFCEVITFRKRSEEILEAKQAAKAMSSSTNSE